LICFEWTMPTIPAEGSTAPNLESWPNLMWRGAPSPRLPPPSGLVAVFQPHPLQPHKEFLLPVAAAPGPRPKCRSLLCTARKQRCKRPFPEQSQASDLATEIRLGSPALPVQGCRRSQIWPSLFAVTGGQGTTWCGMGAGDVGYKSSGNRLQAPAGQAQATPPPPGRIDGGLLQRQAQRQAFHLLGPGASGCRSSTTPLESGERPNVRRTRRLR